ncbi:hypothetical protein F5Y19DRAFT_201244 [Xylariaceae sp. FL1651]|nr:hypothetical protein F5Y19DRAFT_201244 [Xylariaceae sp. FL1651]
MASEEQDLTHNEIWDDSVLIDSWNEALEEYKKYHSIHRNGGNVEDLVKPTHEDNSSDAKRSSHDTGELLDHEGLKTASEMRQDNSNNKQEAGIAATQHSHPRNHGPAPAPEGLLATVRDEGLKRLLMSWYYAGYYTGYYEGQRDSPQDQEVSR